MSYIWKGMKKLAWDEVKQLHKSGKLVGCFRLYNDDTEGMIESDYDFIDDILSHHEKGGEFGMEKSKYRGNTKLNEVIEKHIQQWDGTVHGLIVKNAYENGCDYEAVCDVAGIDYADYEED